MNAIEWAYEIFHIYANKNLKLFQNNLYQDNATRFQRKTEFYL